GRISARLAPGATRSSGRRAMATWFVREEMELGMSDLEKATRRVQEVRQREREILDVALQLFLEQGEDRVTVEMSADKVGIGKGTIYKHFETKNEIYLLLMLRYEEELSDIFQRIRESDDKETLAREYFRFRIS